MIQETINDPKIKNMMTIGVDIDEVVAELAKLYLKYVNEKEGKKVEYEELKRYKFWEAFGIEKEKGYDYVKEMEKKGIMKDMEVVEGAIEGIRELMKNHRIIFVTARPLRAKEETERFIKESLMVKNPEIYYSSDDYHEKNETKSKISICREQGVVYLIEDNPDFFQGHDNENIEILLLDKPWNNNFNGERVHRCKDWGEIVKKIKLLNKNSGRKK